MLMGISFFPQSWLALCSPAWLLSFFAKVPGDVVSTELRVRIQLLPVFLLVFCLDCEPGSTGASPWVC